MKTFKNSILDLLRRKDIHDFLAELDSYPPKKLLGPLFSGILQSDSLARWNAVTAMGHVVARLAQADMEQGRVVMRRLMWSLIDESGGIGWGAPECMGEIMAGHRGLADEFHSILFSYLVESREGKADNFLEYLPLRRGAFWGTARLSGQRPDLGGIALDNTLLALQNEDDPFIMACLCRYFHLIEYVPEGLEAAVTPVADHCIEFYWEKNLTLVPVKLICQAVDR